MICQRSTISGSKQLQSGRQRQAAGDALHLLLHQRLGLAARIGVRRDQQVLEDLLLRRLDQRLVDA